MMLVRSIAVLMGVCLAVTLSAQPQHRNWFFGHHAGLDMSAGTPQAIGGSPMQTDEGVASISDANGQLLFYTNGETVWNAQHQAMPNGTGLAGHFSSSQSALIVPDPANGSRYYVFTTPAQVLIAGGVYDGLSWSMVDMTLDGGWGDVSVKNVELAGPVVEKLSATRHANGVDAWVVAHGWQNATYYAYLVTCTGVEGPVISEAGRAMMNDPGDGRSSAMGCMQFSAQGDRLASVWVHYAADLTHEVRMDVLDFDKATGTLTDAFADTRVPGPQDVIRPYGVCFSPNGRLLYRSDHGLLGGIAYSAILQYDLGAADPMASEQEVATVNSPAIGTLQRHEGRIYAARLDGAQYITRIAQPDVVGTGCTVEHAFASIAPGIGTWGLPNHWDNYPAPAPLDPIALTDTMLCGAASMTLQAVWQHPFHAAQYLWSTGATGPSIVVDTSGLYAVQVILPCTTLFDTVRVTIDARTIELGPDLALCEGDSVRLRIDAADAVSIRWQDGSQDSSHTASRDGLVRVDVQWTNGCLASDSLLVQTRDCRCPFFIPNAFTPNDDGINDQWGPAFECALLDYQLVVYDRWGSPLLHLADPDSVWDGTVQGVPLPSTVLAYDLNYAWHDGKAVQHRARTGHVTLVR